MSRHRIINNQPRHICGWKPDRPDHQDKLFLSNLKVAHLPDHTDLRSYCGPIEDQISIGSCTANSSVSAMEFLAIKMGKPRIEYSRLFLYYAERVKIENGSPSDDSGAQIRDTMKSLATYGVCTEPSWPYDISKFADEPPKAAWDEALQHQILKYARVGGLDGVRSCIAEGYPVVGGFSVPESMENEETARTGIVSYPRPSEQIIGGHAILFVGYSDKTKLITFQNSWGTEWGDKGFGYLPYKYFTSGMASDFWTIRLEEW